MTTQVVEVDGHPLQVSIEGEGPPLLLINGLGGSLATWNPVRPALSDFQTIAFDAPGTGGSPTSRLPQSVPGAAKLARGLLDELGYDQVDVLGFSLGGLVAQQLAISAPARVRRLMLMSTNMGWGSLPSAPRAMGTLFSLRRLHDPEVYAQKAPGLLGGRMRTDPELARQAAESRAADPPDTRGYVWQMLTCASWSTVPFLPLIRQPTLVVNGDDDPLARMLNARWLSWFIRGARLHVVRGGGHYLILERPAEVVSIVRGFFGQGGD